MEGESETAAAGRNSQEMARLAAIPAAYSDGYTVSWWGEGLRISFAKYIAGERHYRAAVMMTLDRAEALAQTLLTSVEQARRYAKTP
jgi:hypothetical protein